MSKGIFLFIRLRTYFASLSPLLNLVYALLYLKIKALHQFDCLRANKSTSAWGVEARVPFLDKEFINVAMSIDPEWKMVKPDMGRIEKWVLRNAFDDEEKPYLPKVCLQNLLVFSQPFSRNYTLYVLTKNSSSSGEFSTFCIDRKNSLAMELDIVGLMV